MDDKYWSYLFYGIIISVVLFLAGLSLAPKKHQGYYMRMQSEGSFTIYRVMNNWDNWPDNTAYRTADRDDAFNKFGKMRILK